MIRLANKDDLVEVGNIVLEFLKDTSYNKQVLDNINSQHIRKLVFNVFAMGWIWLYVKDEKIVGILVAVKEPNLWIPTLFSVRELVWYVKKEARNSLQTL
jgi:hypothetical protein